MNDFLKLLLSLSLSGTVAGLILLLLRRIFQHTVSKAWRYYAWLIVLARLLLPITLPDSPVGNLFTEQPMAAVAEKQIVLPESSVEIMPSEDTAVTAQPVSDATMPVLASISVSAVLFVIWGVVALLLFMRRVTQYQSFMQYLRAGSELVSDPEVLNQYAEVCERVKITHPPELCISRLIATPMLVGMRKSYIVLPVHMEHSDLEKILLHELLHYKRKDAVYKWFAQIVLCLHWFNPGVWFVVKVLAQDCELACDEAVLNLLPPEDYRGYGDALLHAVRIKEGYRAEIAQLALGEDAKQLKERLGIMMQYRKRTRIEKALAICLTTVLCVGTVAVGAYATDTPAAVPSGTQSQNQAVKADASTPEGTLELAMQSMKSLDIDALCVYSNNQKSRANTLYSNGYNRSFKQVGPTMFGGDTSEQQKLNQECVRSLSWKIGKVSVSGDTARIELQVTNRDFGGVMAEIIASSFLDAASGSMDYDTGNEFELLMKAVPDSKMITLSVTATLRNTDGKWKLYLDDALANAVCGDLYEGVESPASKAKIDAASAKLDAYIENSIDMESMQEEIDKAMEDVEAAIREADVENQVREAVRDGLRDAFRW